MNDKLYAIAEEIIGASNGTYDIQYSEEYEALTFEERQQVDLAVEEAIKPCEECGWNFDHDDLSYVLDHGELCWRCAEDALEQKDGQPDEAQEWATYDPDC